MQKKTVYPKELHEQMTEGLKSGALKSSGDIRRYCEKQGHEVKVSTSDNWLNWFKKFGRTNPGERGRASTEFILAPKNIRPARTPTWDEIQDFLINLFEKAKTNQQTEEDNIKLLNINAALKNENAVLKSEAEQFRDSANRARRSLANLGKLNDDLPHQKDRP